MQVSIQDDDGSELKPFETGEICVIGPAVFAGYYDNPEANAKAFRDGWFRTGDLGHMDAQGFVYITGRASDMYISGGSNIYPREVEEKILTHPAIAEVAVLGVPDQMWGEVGVAVCVAREGATRERSRAAAISWRRKCRATRCRSASSSGTRCRNPATARCRSGWSATNWWRAACSTRAATGSARMMRPTYIQQPGPPQRPRIDAVEARGRAFASTLRAGLAAARSRAPRLCRARICRRRRSNMRAWRSAPFAYVMPALSKTGENAAFYSDTFRPAGVTRLKRAR